MVIRRKKEKKLKSGKKKTENPQTYLKINSVGKNAL